MEKLDLLLSDEVVNLADVSVRQKSLDVENTLKEIAEKLPAIDGAALPLRTDVISYITYQGRVARMHRVGTLPADIRLVKRADKVFLARKG